jgi:glycosyltransferase involved in cell wall biosynthesis
MSFRVAIVHPWLPQYRTEFFEKLVARGAVEGIDIDIFYGQTPPEWQSRNDTAKSDRFCELSTRFFGVSGQKLGWKNTTALRSHGRYDALILEHAVRNLETYWLMLRHSKSVCFWGHGKTYTKEIPIFQEKLKSWLTRRVQWFFSYTSGGATSVEADGFPPNRISVVQNSIDTNKLSAQISSVTDLERESFIRTHDLRGKTALFIGGLDASKRIKFLLQSAEEVYKRDRDFRLIIAGNGPDKHLVESYLHQYDWLSYLGPLFENDKAVALACSDVIAMPGRVGLIAVDSFAAGTPIVTTEWAWHAPEYEYLMHGVNAAISANDVVSYRDTLLRVLRESECLDELRAGCVVSSRRYTVEAMVDNFIMGICNLRTRMLDEQAGSKS